MPCTCEVPIVVKRTNVFLGKSVELYLCCLAKAAAPGAYQVADLPGDQIKDWAFEEGQKAAARDQEIAAARAHNARIVARNAAQSPDDDTPPQALGGRPRSLHHPTRTPLY